MKLMIRQITTTPTYSVLNAFLEDLDGAKIKRPSCNAARGSSIRI
jgi:hypothetical protein